MAHYIHADPSSGRGCFHGRSHEILASTTAMLLRAAVRPTGQKSCALVSELLLDRRRPRGAHRCGCRHMPPEGRIGGTCETKIGRWRRFPHVVGASGPKELQRGRRRPNHFLTHNEERESRERDRTERRDHTHGPRPRVRRPSVWLGRLQSASCEACSRSLQCMRRTAVL